MGLRREARELALKALYLFDVSGIPPDEALESVKRGEDLNPKLIDFAQTLFNGAVGDLNEIDLHISECSENWVLERMAAVDRNILRIGTFELLQMKETPVKVIIDEAIEIAKKYSKEDSGKFVNGILDRLKDLRKT
ncbi:MAG: transcription antitermination factor NusB [Elusimicrobiota bacterium]